MIRVINTFRRMVLAVGIIPFVVCFSLGFTARNAFADVTQKDFEVIIRSIGFLQGVSPGNNVFAIIYDPDITTSASEAHQLEYFLKNESASDAMALQPRLVTVANISQLSGAKVIFVTSGLHSYYKRIGDAARTGHALSLSVDRSCVEQKQCVMYINTDSRVEIIVNQAVAEESKVDFKPVFLMMVNVI